MLFRSYDLYDEENVFVYNDVAQIKTDMYEDGTSDCLIVNFTDGTSGLFDPKKGDIVENFPEAAKINEYNQPVYLRPYPLEGITNNMQNPYEGILRISREDGMMAFYSTKEHKYLTDFVYAATGKETMYVDGKPYKFFVLSRNDKFPDNMNEWEVMLPGGTVTSYGWLAQNADGIKITKKPTDRR